MNGNYEWQSRLGPSVELITDDAAAGPYDVISAPAAKIKLGEADKRDIEEGSKSIGGKIVFQLDVVGFNRKLPVHSDKLFMALREPLKKSNSPRKNAAAAPRPGKIFAAAFIKVRYDSLYVEYITAARKGFGGRLMKRIEQMAARLHKSHVDLVSLLDAPTLAFYKKHAYVRGPYAPAGRNLERKMLSAAKNARTKSAQARFIEDYGPIMDTFQGHPYTNYDGIFRAVQSPRFAAPEGFAGHFHFFNRNEVTETLPKMHKRITSRRRN